MGRENLPPSMSPQVSQASPAPRVRASPHASPKRKFGLVPICKRQPIGALDPLDNYDITDVSNSEDEDKVDRSHKTCPSWSRGWSSRVRAQSEIDTDSIFGKVGLCNLEEV